MLKKKERLNKEEFNRFFSYGNRYHSPSLFLIYSPHKEFHAAVVVSKKVSTKAIVRNKIRRRIYDIVRSQKKNLNLNGIFIIITKPRMHKKEFIELKQEISELIEKVPTKHSK